MWRRLINHWRELAAGLLLLLSIGQTTKVFAILKPDQWPLDADIYLEAAQKWREGGDPYQDLGYGPSLAYFYPPLALALMWPLTFLPRDAAVYLWVTSGYFFFGGMIYLTLRLMESPVTWTRWALTTALGMQTFSFKFNLGMGQINLLVIFVVMLALYLWQRRHKSFLAGVLFGVATQLKVIPIFMLPYFVVKKQWQVVAGLVLSMVVSFCFWPALSWQYVTQVATRLNIYGVTLDNYYDQSLSSALARLAGSSELWGRVTLVWAVWWFGWWLYWSWREQKLTVVPPLMLLMIGMMARSPIWPHYLVYIYPLVLVSFADQWWWLVVSWLVLQLHFDNVNVASQRVPLWLVSTGTYWYLGVLYLVSYQHLRGLKTSGDFATLSE